MPELPEVETIARALRPTLIGRTIRAAQVLWPRTISVPTAEQFEQQIAGQTIQSIGRRAKYLLIHLDRQTLIVHLRMSGDLAVVDEAEPPAPHDRVLLALDGSQRLAFNDARKFGRMWLTDAPQNVFANLGPEPLASDFTPALLGERLLSSRRQLKPLLLDQSVLAGMGNIYTDEALHRAGLHPLRNSATLTEAELVRLWQAIRDALEEGIRRNGASIDWVYRGGDFQNHFRVYQRTGEPCPVCGRLVQRIVVGQRGTHFCPGCQPLV